MSSASFAPNEIATIARRCRSEAPSACDASHVSSGPATNACAALPEQWPSPADRGPTKAATTGSMARRAMSQSSTREIWPDRESRKTASG